MDKKTLRKTTEKDKDSKIGQGFNNSRGEIDDKKNTPKNNGQNVDNDPAHQREKEQNQVK